MRSTPQGVFQCEETMVPGTAAELIHHEGLGDLVEHRRIDLTVFDAPQRAARNQVRTALTGRAAETRVEEAVLVADELVGNAVQHTEGPVALVLEIFANGAVVGVVDRGYDTRAVPVDPLGPGRVDETVDVNHPSEGGRGMLIVALYATAWAVRAAAKGKMVVAVFILSGGEC